MKNKLRFLLVAIAIGLMSLYCVSSSPAYAQETYKFNLAFAGSPQSFSARAHAWWAEEVERRTNGRVKITAHWGGSLASHREMVKLVGTGAVDMGESVWAPYNPQVFPCTRLPTAR